MRIIPVLLLLLLLTSCAQCGPTALQAAQSATQDYTVLIDGTLAGRTAVDFHGVASRAGTSATFSLYRRSTATVLGSFEDTLGRCEGLAVEVVEHEVVVVHVRGPATLKLWPELGPCEERSEGLRMSRPDREVVFRARR